MLKNMSIKTTVLYVSGLFVAVSGPISMYSASNMMSGSQKGQSATPAATTSMPQQQGGWNSAAPTPMGDPSAAPLVAIAAPTSSSSTTPTPSLTEVLRFDATVEWVMHRWPRVTTGLPYMQLQGYRAPLVTGTAMSDVAGSLTYYFNAQQQVQRITLRGTIGDPSVLVTILTTQHRFTRRLTNDPGVVVYESVDSSGRPAGTLQIRSANVISVSEPRTRFEIDLVMDRAE
jgi:hypothetical protein